jgi:hypothetical protein
MFKEIFIYVLFLRYVDLCTNTIMYVCKYVVVFQNIRNEI